jgi:hypothetical protein
VWGMGGFGERLHDAMAVSGIGSVEELAVRCGGAAEVIVRAIATAGESLSGRQLMILSEVLNVRPRWLLDGDLPMVRVARSRDETEALALLQSMPPEKARAWLAMGRRITRRT